MPRILIIKPIMEDRAEALEPLAAAAGVELVQVPAQLGRDLPRATDFDALMTLGGPEHPHEHQHPESYLKEVQARLREGVEAGIPVMGLCLGAQMLASAFGARWHPAGVEEIGACEVELTDAGEADPLFAGVPRRLSVIQYHSDTFEMPAGAVQLARGGNVHNQAFRIGERGYALQWHAECTAPQFASWIDLSLDEVAASHGQGVADRLCAEVAAGDAEREVWRTRLFANWLAMLSPLGVPSRS